jgi:hypothetical protein
MRWVVIPLVAGLLFVTSGFLHELESTTKASAALARTSREAPETALEGARGVEDLPVLASLTEQQARAFDALADALDVSARRVFSLTDLIDKQATSIGGLKGILRGLGQTSTCVGERLRRLTEVTDDVPPRLRRITTTLISLIDSQQKSIRHLRSINRKLTLLGVAAEFSDVKVPPLPRGGRVPEQEVGASTGADCHQNRA